MHIQNIYTVHWSALKGRGKLNQLEPLHIDPDSIKYVEHCLRRVGHAEKLKWNEDPEEFYNIWIPRTRTPRMRFPRHRWPNTRNSTSTSRRPVPWSDYLAIIGDIARIGVVVTVIWISRSYIRWILSTWGFWFLIIGYIVWRTWSELRENPSR